jgi:ribonuclease PH
VATSSGELIEVQGGAEGKPVAAELYVQLVAQGIGAVQQVLERVRGSL